MCFCGKFVGDTYKQAENVGQCGGFACPSHAQPRICSCLGKNDVPNGVALFLVVKPSNIIFPI